MRYVMGVSKAYYSSKGQKYKTRNRKYYFLMNLIWRVANSEEFGFQPLRRFTTKLRYFRIKNQDNNKYLLL